MKDYLYKGRMDDLDVAFSLCVATDVVQDVVVRHDCDPVSAHLLGRALTAGLLSAAQLGPSQRLNVHWKYEGHLRTLVVDAGSDGTVRGLISPTDLSSYDSDKPGLYGEGGRLHVTRTRDGGILSSSTTSCRLQEIVEDLGYFISTSDQVETGLSVMIGFNRDAADPIGLCQGLLVQALPGCELKQFDAIRARLHAPEVRDLLSRPSERDNYFETLVNTLAAPVCARPVIHLTDCGCPRFVCTCTQDKMAAVLRAIPRADRDDIVAKGEDLVVHCRFCRTRYRLSIPDCLAVWQEKNEQGAGPGA